MNDKTRETISQALSRMDDSRQQLAKAVKCVGPMPSKIASMFYDASSYIDSAMDMLRHEYEKE